VVKAVTAFEHDNFTARSTATMPDVLTFEQPFDVVALVLKPAGDA
jgi:hypothetical protein